MGSHESLAEFLSMSGYGSFVWSSFALTVIVMVANYVSARRRHSSVLAHLRRRHLEPEQTS
ncbi:MAG: heme exporter protein CcmD [Pseudomonadota bacterium]